MLTRRWEPLAEMNRLREEMERVFGRHSIGQLGRLGTGVFPALNVWESDDHFSVEAELPGFELDDLEILVTGGNELSIKGQRKAPQFEEGVWHRKERRYGSFSRVMGLPSDVDSAKVSAELKHGVLTITLPKCDEVKPRRIEVKAG